MCDGMNLDRRLMLLGVMLVVLSMTMATQYATTKITYSYALVHPSDADIRFIGSDNSTDGRVLAVAGTNGTTASLTFHFGNWSAGTNVTYTACFGIVNEETNNVNITHINVSTSAGSDYLQIWLHGDRDTKAGSDGTSVLMWNEGSLINGADSPAWVLGSGDSNSENMSAGAGSNIPTTWDDFRGVRYSTANTNAVNGTSDFVWVQISLDLPSTPTATNSGTIWIHFQASDT